MTPFFHATAESATMLVSAVAAAAVVRAGPCALSHVGFTSNVVKADAS